MYTLTDNDVWFVGQMHQLHPHDCHVSPDSGCQFYEDLIKSYGGAKDVSIKRKLVELRTRGD